MGLFFTQIPVLIQDHIKDMQKMSNLSDDDESLEIISEAWLHKKSFFEHETENYGLEIVSSLEKDDKRGAIIMTYSGCLLNIGPIVSNGRNLEFTKIELTKNKPKVAVSSCGILANDVDVDNEILFTKGPVKRTPAVYKIAVCRELLNAREQKKILKDANHAIRKEFTEINKEIVAI